MNVYGHTTSAVRHHTNNRLEGPPRADLYNLTSNKCAMNGNSLIVIVVMVMKGRQWLKRRWFLWPLYSCCRHQLPTWLQVWCHGWPQLCCHATNPLGPCISTVQWHILLIPWKHQSFACKVLNRLLWNKMRILCLSCNHLIDSCHKIAWSV